MNVPGLTEALHARYLGLDTVPRPSRDAAVRLEQCNCVYTQALIENGPTLAKDESGFSVSSRELKIAFRKELSRV